MIGESKKLYRQKRINARAAIQQQQDQLERRQVNKRWLFLSLSELDRHFDHFTELDKLMVNDGIFILNILVKIACCTAFIVHNLYETEIWVLRAIVPRGSGKTPGVDDEHCFPKSASMICCSPVHKKQICNANGIMKSKINTEKF